MSKSKKREEDEAPVEPRPSGKVKFKIYGEEMIDKKVHIELRWAKRRNPHFPSFLASRCRNQCQLTSYSLPMMCVERMMVFQSM